MKKIIGYSVLGLIGLALILGIFGIRHFNNKYFKERPAYLELTHGSQAMHFKWTNQKVEGHIEYQTGLLIPVQIQDLEHNLYMQFDTGAPDSFFYEKDLKSLRNLGYAIEEVQKDGFRFVKSLKLKLGGQPVTLSMVKIYPNYGNTFSAEFNSKININIGAIGSDILVDRITSIDFKNQTIQFFEQRPEWMQGLKGFKAFDFPGRRVMLPAIVDGKKYEFLYDSGCSAFGLITTKQRFEKYSDASTPVESFGAKSWEDKIYINSKSSDYPLSIGGAKLTMKRVSCVDMYAFLQPLVTPFTRIGGWMGNQAINESRLILDTKSKEFLITN
ncbi:hypothetical protein [Gaetbulibacter aestuarii]|uniref:Aspartyl protease n=1 Tax=Gaetbulibacter aestuarii TaxID=1502358 RepID=A0ABW7MVR7_9FLAO